MKVMFLFLIMREGYAKLFIYIIPSEHETLYIDGRSRLNTKKTKPLD